MWHLADKLYTYCHYNEYSPSVVNHADGFLNTQFNTLLQLL